MPRVLVTERSADDPIGFIKSGDVCLFTSAWHDVAGWKGQIDRRARSEKTGEYQTWVVWVCRHDHFDHGTAEACAAFTLTLLASGMHG